MRNAPSASVSDVSDPSLSCFAMPLSHLVVSTASPRVAGVSAGNMTVCHFLSAPLNSDKYPSTAPEMLPACDLAFAPPPPAPPPTPPRPISSAGSGKDWCTCCEAGMKEGIAWCWCGGGGGSRCGSMSLCGSGAAAATGSLTLVRKKAVRSAFSFALTGSTTAGAAAASSSVSGSTSVIGTLIGANLRSWSPSAFIVRSSGRLRPLCTLAPPLRPEAGFAPAGGGASWCVATKCGASFGFGPTSSRARRISGCPASASFSIIECFCTSASAGTLALLLCPPTEGGYAPGIDGDTRPLFAASLAHHCPFANTGACWLLPLLIACRTSDAEREAGRSSTPGLAVALACVSPRRLPTCGMSPARWSAAADLEASLGASPSMPTPLPLLFAAATMFECPPPPYLRSDTVDGDLDCFLVARAGGGAGGANLSFPCCAACVACACAVAAAAAGPLSAFPRLSASISSAASDPAAPLPPPRVERVRALRSRAAERSCSFWK
mmetsp:Transcript_17152/g.56138  ORF Transcript_17152/g.56138 Transcript_17152/m.56138 type:complete len:494 (-) Transcript_17152:564-2045(-)